MGGEEKERKEKERERKGEEKQGEQGEERRMKKEVKKGKKEEMAENNLKIVEISDEVKKAYIDYSMSVIVARALPNVEDGLKPVQRRILYTLHLLGMHHNKPTKKSARVVGEVLGKFHPHGDVSVYEALARMAQDFSMRYCLVDGQGNFGSIDGDAPAAMRYTECRLSSIAEEMLQDIDKDTVKMMPNFDNTLQEPEVLPAKLPNLLLNGSQGIAVGMTTSIPPHNLSEVVDGIIAYIDNPNISIDELMQYIKGPDFPTGGIIFSTGLKEMYQNGIGKVIMRGVVDVEEKGNKKAIVIKEIPYQVNKAMLVKEIAKLIETKKITDVADLRDESSKKGIRIVLQLRKEANEKLIINRLYALTSLETNFNGIFVALVDGAPKLLNLKDLIKHFVEHRINVVKKRTQFDLNQALEKKHLLDGIMIALKNIDAIIELIRKADSVATAEKALIEKYGLSQKQAQAILEMKLSKLTKLEVEKIKEEKESEEKKIAQLSEILKSEKNILEVIKKELLELKKKYGDERRTKIKGEKKEVKELELIKKEDVVITVSYRGYINVVSLDEFREQKRGGKGVIGTMLAENDYINKILTCSTHDNFFLITNRGNAFMLKAYELQKSSRYGKGKHISNFVNIKADEKLRAVFVVKEQEKEKWSGYILMITKKGMIKKLALEDLKNVKRSGVRIIKLPFEDEVVSAFVIDKDKEILVATKKGMAVRFNSAEVRQMGRAAYGVIAIKLKQDEVADMDVVDGKDVLVVTNKGFGKRTKLEEYRTTKRGAIGIRNILLTSRNGLVVCSKCIEPSDSIMLITKQGIIIRFKASDIREMGRATQGVRLIKLKQDDEVIDVEVIKKLGEEKGEEEKEKSEKSAQATQAQA
jgi:DNA gyrase subunit A